MTSRPVPSGKVYRQLFDAQVQLSRSLLAGNTRTDCLSSEDNRLSSTTSSRWQRVDDVIDDVSRLPDTIAAHHPCSGITEHLTERKYKKHEEALKHLDEELTGLTQVCETQVRTISQELLSCLQDVDLRLDALRDGMEQLEHLDHEVCGLWEQAEREVTLKKRRILELKHKLTESEAQRTNEIRAVLGKHCHLLEKISFLTPHEVHRLIHTEAMMLNQALLANRRSTARLVLLLQEGNLQQELLLRLHWKDCLNRWKRSRVTEVIHHFRTLCSSDRDQDQQLISVQRIKQTQLNLAKKRCDLISGICSLVPPTCSTALVTDWFIQLTAVNQQIESLHADLLHQLRCHGDRTWSDQLSEVAHCQEALSALQLSEDDVDNLVRSQLLTPIGQSQRLDEEQLAALDVCCDSVSRHAVSLSRCAFVAMRGAALLWETHNCRLKRRQEEIQQHLDDLRRSQHRHTQREKAQLDDLLGILRQESNEDTLMTSLEKTVLYLQDVKDSCKQYACDQCAVLDRLPSVSLDELFSYSSSLSSFYHLTNTYAPSPEELHVENLHLFSTKSSTLEMSLKVEITDHHPMGFQNDSGPSQLSQDWLTEAESSLLYLCDFSRNAMFTSSQGVAYTGPAFRCPTPSLPGNLERETHLSLFPAELLTYTLSRTRTLFMDHLEQHFHDVLSSTIATVTDRKKAVYLEQEFQLQQLNPQYIHTHIYQPRQAELQVHQQCVDCHCQDVLDVLTSCRTQLQELQFTISRKNLEFSATLSSMENDILTAASSLRLEMLSSTLQNCLDQHVKHIQTCQTAFRQAVQVKLDQVRHTTTQLLSSFRLFSEGGDCAPPEVKLLRKKLIEQTKQISGTEEALCSELGNFESRTLQQVREVSGRLEEKLSLLKSELGFMEMIQSEISNTQILIRTEAVSCQQQQAMISSRLEDLRKMMEDRQVSPDQAFPLLSSVSEDLMKQHQYLSFELEDLTSSGCLKSSKKVQSTPPSGLVEPSSADVDFLDDPVVGVIKSLNRFSLIQNKAAGPVGPAGRQDTGQSPTHLEQKNTESVNVLRSCRSARNQRWFHIFGSKPEPKQNSHSFSSTVDSLLWRTNDVVLQAAENFYSRERLTGFLLLPDTLDTWMENMQQRLLGYHDQARRFLRTSRKDLLHQLSLFEDLLLLFPSTLISNYKHQMEVGLKEEVGGVKQQLEETMVASEQEKTDTVRQLRASLSCHELQKLISREELRQQQLRDNICRSHLKLQECARVQGEEFITSLASLTEKLFCLLDNLLIPAKTDVASQKHVVDSTVTVETGADLKPCGKRVWSGISYLSLPPDEGLSSVITATTASISTYRCTLGHLNIIEQRDTAVKEFEQLFRSEMLRLEEDKRKQLRELHNWNTHWRQQIHSLRHATGLYRSCDQGSGLRGGGAI